LIGESGIVMTVQNRIGRKVDLIPNTDCLQSIMHVPVQRLEIVEGVGNSPVCISSGNYVFDFDIDVERMMAISVSLKRRN